MSCVAVTRGGSGEFWLFDSLELADEHALIQYGDAFCCGPAHVLDVFSPGELPGLAHRLGDARLQRDLDSAVQSGASRAGLLGLGERLWQLMLSSARRPPQNAAEVLRIVAADRRATRASGVQHRSQRQQEPDMAAAAAAAKEAEAPRRPISRSKNYSAESVISFGKDAEGKAYGPDNNPKRAGSAAHTRFALYKAGMTVTQAKEAGVTSGDLNWDIKQGFITVG